MITSEMIGIGRCPKSRVVALNNGRILYSDEKSTNLIQISDNTFIQELLYDISFDVVSLSGSELLLSSPSISRIVSTVIGESKDFNILLEVQKFLFSFVSTPDHLVTLTTDPWEACWYDRHGLLETTTPLGHAMETRLGFLDKRELCFSQGSRLLSLEPYKKPILISEYPSSIIDLYIHDGVAIVCTSVGIHLRSKTFNSNVWKAADKQLVISTWFDSQEGVLLVTTIFPQAIIRVDISTQAVRVQDINRIPTLPAILPGLDTMLFSSGNYLSVWRSDEHIEFQYNTTISSLNKILPNQAIIILKSGELYRLLL